MKLFKQQANKVSLDGRTIIRHREGVTAKLERYLPLNNREWKNVRAGLPVYLLFSAFDEHSGDNILYVLVSQDVLETDMARIETAKLLFGKSYARVVENFALPSVLQQLYDEFSGEKATAREALDKQHWISHFNNILAKAVNLKTSDIHIIVREEGATVQVRVHGVLTEIDKYTASDMLRMISSAYNQMASAGSKDQSFSPNLVHETAITRTINDIPYQLRFISRPIYPAGSFVVVMRLLPLSAEGSSVMSLQEIGYSPSQIDAIDTSLSKPSGLIVTSGKVGCGKSTTNQTLLTNILRNAEYKIKAYTVEFPVEYVIEGAVQMELKRDKRESEEEANRKLIGTLDDILRMDPDVLLLGEIRGNTVATLAKQMVQSGHKVLSTVHTQSALKIFNRFLGLGLDRDVLTEPDFFSCMIYQALVRQPCEHCAFTLEDYEKHSGDTAFVARLKNAVKTYQLKSEQLKAARIINEKGCQHCTGGIGGRTVVAEVVYPELDILEALRMNQYAEAYRLWRASGAMTVTEHGLLKIFQGLVCPVDFERTIEPIGFKSVYHDIDEQFYATVLNNELKRC